MRLPWSRRPAEVEAAPEPERARLFSTDMRGQTAAATVEILNRRLRAARPKVAPGVTAAMDEYDLDAVKLDDLGAPNVSEALFAWYGLQSFIGYQMCALIAQHWLIDKACAMPARDAVRHGFTLTIPDQKDEAAANEIKTAIAAADKRFALKRQMIDFVRMGRMFGVRVALFKVESPDPDYYKNPFNPDGVTPGSYKGIVQIDPYWIMPQFDNAAINDPTSIGFYEPTWYQINGNLYHKSHLCIFKTSEPADLLKPLYQYGGIPVPQMIMERVYAAERTANEAPQLAMTKRLNVWKTDLSHVLANQDKFATHMQNFSAYRDNYGMKIVDADDDVAQFDTTLTGLDDLIGGQYELVSAAARVPVTKLMGTTPKGLNSTGGYEESSYHEELETIQENDLTAFVDRHHLLLARSEIEPALKLAPGSLTIDVEWAPLDSPDAKEYAEINLTKAQTDDYLASIGAIDGEDVRNRIRREADSGYTGISPDVPEPPEAEVEPAAPPPKPAAKNAKA